MVNSPVAARETEDSLATLAHELRTPLGSILNSVNVMRMAPANAELMARARATIERQALHMKQLIDDLLDAGRTARQRQELNRTRVDLGVLLEEAVEAIRSSPEGRSHTVTMARPGQSLALDADSARLTQVFGNLLTNACKYTDAGGRIAASVERSGSQAVVRITDDGIGIAPDMLLGVFERYVQVDGSARRALGGVGIGLALAKDMVERHGGTIVAESAGLGRGSVFIVRLPMPLARKTAQPVLTAQGFDTIFAAASIPGSRPAA